MKKPKREKMIKEMIQKGGKSKIRDGFRKYTTTKVNWKEKAKQKREHRQKVNTANMKKTQKVRDM